MRNVVCKVRIPDKSKYRLIGNVHKGEQAMPVVPFANEACAASVSGPTAVAKHLRNNC